MHQTDSNLAIYRNATFLYIIAHLLFLSLNLTVIDHLISKAQKTISQIKYYMNNLTSLDTYIGPKLTFAD